MTTMKIRIVMHYEFKLKNSAAEAHGNNTVCNVGTKNLIPGMNLSKTTRAVRQYP